MRVAQYAITEVDRYIEEGQRAKNRLDFDRWRAELRPRAMQIFASRAARLTKADREEIEPTGHCRPVWRKVEPEHDSR